MASYISLLLDSYQFHEAARNVPVLDVKIAIGVPVGTVCAAENTFDPSFLRNIETATGFRVGIVSQHGNDGVVLVQYY